MKKVVSVVLCLLVLLSAVSFCITAADDSLPFIVATDLHYFPTPDVVPVNYPGEKYYSASNASTMRTESGAIIRRFLEEAARSSAQFVLLCGDLTETGAANEHRTLSAMLSEFEMQTGKRVYAIDGNHDFNSGVTVEQFKAYYAEFGYDEALTVDAETCSYTAELDAQYRLLALDSCDHTAGRDGITDALLSWANEQAQQAKRDGKKLIVMMHHNFLEHLKLQAKLLPAFIIRPEIDMKTHLLDWGVRYAFTGHFHAHDITSYTDKNNRTVYDVTTTSLSGYPCLYRTCTLTDAGLRTDSRRIESVSEAYLPQSGYTPELLEELTHDLDAYAQGCFRNAFNSHKDSYFGREAMRSILVRIGGRPVQYVIDACYDAFYDNLILPIYTADAPDGKSLQALGEQMGLRFVSSDNKTVWDCLYYFATVIYKGDENVPYNDPQIELFMQCCYTALYDAMRTASKTMGSDLLYGGLPGSLRTTAVPFAVVSAAKLALGTVRNDRALETVLLIMAPIIEIFSMDDDIPDGSAFLPAEDAPQTVFDVIRNVFQYILAAIRRAFRGFGSIYFPKVFA